MTIKIRTAAGLMSIKSIRVNDGVSTRRVVKIKVRTALGAGGLNQVYIGVLPITLSFSPPDIDATGTNGPTVTATAIAIVAGGLAPFTYAWSVVSFSAAATPTITGTAIANPTFTQTGVPLFGSQSAVFRVVINDNTGQTATADLAAIFRQNQSIFMMSLVRGSACKCPNQAHHAVFAHGRAHPIWNRQRDVDFLRHQIGFQLMNEQAKHLMDDRKVLAVEV